MHEQTIIDDLLARLDLQECDVKVISLVCTVEALTRRLNKDINAGIRKADVLERSLSRLPMYETLNTIKIDVSYSTPGEVADLIVLQ